MSKGTLFAVLFDSTRLEMVGRPVPILEDVRTSILAGSAQLDFSRDGTLVYLPAKGLNNQVAIFRMDSQGEMDSLLNIPGDYTTPQFSPDGKRLALSIEKDGNRNIWIYELERGTLSRLTFHPGLEHNPVWTPDGQRVTFHSNRHGGAANIYWKRADFMDDAERLTESQNPQFAADWSPDGSVFSYFELDPETGFDVWMLPMERDGAKGTKPGKLVPFSRTPFVELGAYFSSDGRWVAYLSNESGSGEIYVRPYPGPGGKWQVSSGGGTFCIWSKNGRELFYLNREVPRKIMVVPYSADGDLFRAGKPRLWSDGEIMTRGNAWSFGLHPDGKRFAVLKAAEDTEAQEVTHVNIVTNWFDEVSRLVASAGGN